MDKQERARLKDLILNHFLKQRIGEINSLVIYEELKQTVTTSEVSELLDEIIADKYINRLIVGGFHSSLSITPLGTKFIKNSSYTIQLTLAEEQERERNKETLRNEEKTNLEITNLKNSIWSHKFNIWISISAIIISVISLFISIFLR